MVSEESRTVGELTVRFDSLGRLDATFKDRRRIRLAPRPLEMLWHLAEHPDQMVPKVELYQAMYGDLPAAQRPGPGVLNVFGTLIRRQMRLIHDTGSDDYLKTDFHGSLGIFSTAGPLGNKGVSRGPKNKGVTAALLAVRQA